MARAKVNRTRNRSKNTRRWKGRPGLCRIFEVLMESSDDGLLLFDRRMRVLYMNRACERLTGRPREEVIGERAKCSDLMCCHDEFGCSLASDPACPVRRFFKDNPPDSISREMMIKHKDGTETWIEGRYFPVKGGSGKVECVIAILRDISERKAMEDQLLESRKLAAFGVLTAGIAHELKNPLGILRSAAEIIAAPGRTDAERREAAEFIKIETMRLDRIIKEFLAYARPNPPKLAETDLNDLVDYSIDVFRTRGDGAEKIRIEKHLAPDAPKCWIDAAQIHQVLLNLLLNAEQAIGEEGAIAVATRREGEWAIVEVGDSGPGIAPNQVGRIFDPFYTTKPEGSGLGLAVVRRIVTEHQGRIKVGRSSLGGALISIKLPIHPAERPIPVETDPGASAIAGVGSLEALRRRITNKD